MLKYFLSYVRFYIARNRGILSKLNIGQAMRKIILPLLIVSMGLASCKKDKEDLSEMAQGHKFFPLELGKYILYDVDSTYWDDFLKAEIHHRSQVRYDVVDNFEDNEGRLSYVINVMARNTDVDPFRPNDVIYATPTSGSVVLKQRNLSFIKMVFPVNNGGSWNGNAMIPLQDQDYVEFDNDKWVYTYANFDKEFDPGNNLYEHTVTVNHIDDRLNNPDADSTAYAYQNYSQEIYAYNVGMIYKERVYWVFQPKPGGSGYRKGYRVIMKAVENN
jgi:hypothetical protein